MSCCRQPILKQVDLDPEGVELRIEVENLMPVIEFLETSPLFRDAAFDLLQTGLDALHGLSNRVLPRFADDSPEFINDAVQDNGRFLFGRPVQFDSKQARFIRHLDLDARFEVRRIEFRYVDFSVEVFDRWIEDSARKRQRCQSR